MLKQIGDASVFGDCLQYSRREVGNIGKPDSRPSHGFEGADRVRERLQLQEGIKDLSGSLRREFGLCRLTGKCQGVFRDLLQVGVGPVERTKPSVFEQSRAPCRGYFLRPSREILLERRVDRADIEDRESVKPDRFNLATSRLRFSDSVGGYGDSDGGPCNLQHLAARGTMNERLAFLLVILARVILSETE